METTDREPTTTIHVAHIGNSIQFFNDGPNLLTRMLQQKYPSSLSSSIIQNNSCLRGGATLASLLEKGNGRHFTEHAATTTDPDNCSIGSPTVQDLLAERSWDFVIMNDHTQSPSRTHSKEETLQVLHDQYLPLLLQQQQQQQQDTCLSPSNTTKSMSSKSERPTKSLSSSSSLPKIIFLQTAAYRFPGTNNSTDLGTFDQFTEGTYQGYLEYTNLFPPTMAAVVAPVGRAYQFLKNNNTTAIITNTTSNDQRRRRRDDETTNHGDVILHQDDDDDDESISSSSSSSSSSFLLWEKLYAHDDFHPSAHGTLLQTNVLYCTIVNEPPPVYDSAWWTTARFMQPPSTTSGGEQPYYPLPTKEEADILRRVACIVCNILIDS